MRHRDDLGRIIQVRRNGLKRRPLSGDLLAEHGFDDRLLRFEVVVERPEPDVGLVGDLIDAGALDALAGEQRLGGFQKLAPSPLPPPRMPIPMWCLRGATRMRPSRHM